MPYETSPITISPSLETLSADPSLVGRMTESLGQNSAVYFELTASPSPKAEVALRNPATFANDEVLADLPDPLQNFWAVLEADAQLVTKEVGLHVRDWQTPETGLEKLHRYVAQGTFNTHPDSRKSVAEIMARGSRLFAVSAVYAADVGIQSSDNEFVYASNVDDLGKFLDRVLVEI